MHSRENYLDLGATVNISEETFVLWSQGPSQTETQKCENAERAIRKAIDDDSNLNSLDISVFAQGSYRARTNIRQESDVDICVRCNDAFFGDYPEGKTREDFGFGASSLHFSDFKNMVETALKNYFGAANVARGNKAFGLHANTYRIEADVVPTFEHRRYTGRINPNGSNNYEEGVAFKTDGGVLIRNWPEQNYQNGVRKNNECNRHYKRVVRILKNLRCQMKDENIAEANNVGSFLIECLVWNAPNSSFFHSTYTADLREVLAHIFNKTLNDVDCNEWGEINELKYLFRQSQPWTRQQAHIFLSKAWDYIGYQ